MDTMQQVALASGVVVGIAGGAALCWAGMRRRLAREAAKLAASLERDASAPPPVDTLLLPVHEAHSRSLRRWKALLAESAAENRQLSSDMLALMRQIDGASRAKERFLASTGHDLRQPLQALELGLANIRRSASQAQLEELERMQASMRALNDLTDGMLLLSQLDSHNIEANAGACDIQDLFDELRASHLRKAESAGLQLDLRARGSRVLADAGLLGGLLGRLIDNAINATPAGGRVAVVAHRRGNIVRIEVRDNGIGIAPVHQPRLFDEFFQVGNPERDHRKGLGLGLAIASRLATLLGTRVELRSRMHGGSCFWLDLPWTAQELAQSHVWMLGRDSSHRRATETLLNGWGYRVGHIKDAELPSNPCAGRSGAAVRAILYWPEGPGDPGWPALARLGDLYPQAVRLVVAREPDTAMLELARLHRARLLLTPVAPAKLRALLGWQASPVSGAA